ncbi:conserved exported hypothetical protein [uncultured Desulfatiglans sp.]|uniref:CBM-cenC domain-containing protein n=1 Tax=Uncultured Desulfatiglans sp. TaxID=1748965 RepID=A0A653A651_UNCDX|nr:conserved exported hypothetical protein [uncultured Desulfatiglans sp.]
MISDRILCVIAAMLFAGCVHGCSGSSDEAIELKHFPVDHLEGVISQDGVCLDTDRSSDGKGSIRIDAGGRRSVRLYETGDVDVENARVVYQAKLSTEALEGKTYLEMWCHFPDGGEYFSKGLQSALSGTNGWVTVETPFMLQSGQNPDNIRLNLVIEGAGTVWVDDIHLYGAPLG